MDVDILAFSSEQQGAILAHALREPKVFELLDKLGTTKDWFEKQSHALGDLYSYIESFRKTFKKNPISFEEVIDSIKDELIVKAAAKRVADFCEKQYGLYQWEVLETKLNSWAIARLLKTTTQEIAVKFNEGKQQEAQDLFKRGVLELQKQECLTGASRGTFISAAERVKLEKASRLEESDRILPIGISYLQDSLNGILPSDVVLLGADSGVGKTEAARILACHVTKEKQLPVHFFALEAEENEIERRIVYGLMGGWYKDDHVNIPEGMISYKNYRYNRLDNEFAPYEKRAWDFFEKEYKFLQTHYGIVTSKELEQKVYEVKNESALIIVDHLHYMDLGENENYEMTKLVKGIKETNLALKLPFLLLCHINKSNKKFNARLVPAKEDFHGSSNIFKISTQAIMLSRAYNFISTSGKCAGTPTFIRVVKARVDGGATYHVGIGFFNTYTNSYSENYTVGHLSADESKWTPSFGKWPHWANEDRLVKDVSEVT